MLNIQFDIRKINILKNMFFRLRKENKLEAIQADFDEYFHDVSLVDILLLELELINGEYGIMMEDVKRFCNMLPRLSGKQVDLTNTHHQNHPVQIFKEENCAIEFVLSEITLLLESIEEDEKLLQESVMIDELKRHILCLGEFHNHFNRKEKIFFPILERFGQYALATRTVWRKDDRIRAFYKALKNQTMQLPNIDFAIFQKTFSILKQEMDEMIFQEESIILPILISLFSDEDWEAVAVESDAFGYTIIEAPKRKWKPKRKDIDEVAIENDVNADNLVFGGGGFLTTEEAKHILNNLPLEITFVDKTAIFRYFNEITKDASEMMLVRTPSSIGRNVANCHPPKSLKKVMTVIRDLKTGRRQSESMWFKKKDEYIHITYKAIHNDQGEFLGILEYVQDIQPFYELPVEVKMGLSKIEE